MGEKYQKDYFLWWKLNFFHKKVILPLPRKPEKVSTFFHVWFLTVASLSSTSIFLLQSLPALPSPHGAHQLTYSFSRMGPGSLSCSSQHTQCWHFNQIILLMIRLLIQLNVCATRACQRCWLSLWFNFSAPPCASCLALPLLQNASTSYPKGSVAQK